ncbi:MAG: nicotinate-nucleotide adenylyltransferase [Proteobacteria bacterium]|nr:nicotinate-nucleotide adenylyltransferase [Pseudomonadota bacterium]
MIGIYGGMFDPVHFGHLRPALEVQQALGLGEVRFVPVGQPHHRDAPRASATLRVAMLQAAIADQPGFVLDEREITRAGPSYMVDTLASLRAEVGRSPLCLILGYDAFLGLPDWHQWTRLIELAHLVVTHRPGWTTDALSDALQELVEQHRLAPGGLSRQPAGGVCFVPVTQLAISSTRIREQIGAGQDVRYLLPDQVVTLIKNNNLYR